MDGDKITRYYRLCTVANGGLTHPSKKLTREAIAALYGGPKNVGALFSEVSELRVPNERVVGGVDMPVESTSLEIMAAEIDF